VKLAASLATHPPLGNSCGRSFDRPTEQAPRQSPPTPTKNARWCGTTACSRKARLWCPWRRLPQRLDFAVGIAVLGAEHDSARVWGFPGQPVPFR